MKIQLQGCINAQNVANLLLRKVMRNHTASQKSPGGAQNAQKTFLTKRISKDTLSHARESFSWFQKCPVPAPPPPSFVMCAVNGGADKLGRREKEEAGVH